jgi:hypothetical protein
MTEVNGKIVYTLAEIEKKLKVEQHRLIHLCEKGVVTPDFEDAAGRGTMRRFSERNLFPLMKVLRAFETYAAKEIVVFSLPKSLQNKPAVRLSIVVIDGSNLFFILRYKGETSYIGALNLEGSPSLKGVKTSHDDPTHSFTSRLEIDLTRIAQSL